MSPQMLFHKDILMIIHPSVLCKDYQKEIMENFHGGESSQDQFRCSNPDCRCDKFYRHGTYFRYFIDLNEIPDLNEMDSLTVERLSEAVCSVTVQQVQILRVRCMGCGITHSILTADMVPFRGWSLLLLFFLLLMICSSGQGTIDSYTHLHENVSFSWKFLKHLVFVFLKYNSSMLSAIRFGGLYQNAHDPSARELLLCFLGGIPFSFPSQPVIQYLKLFQSPLFVSRRNTVSYPLRYLFPKSLFF